MYAPTGKIILVGKSLAQALVGCCFLVAVSVSANEAHPLVQNSPFLPPDHNRAQDRAPAPTPPPGANVVSRDLELRGIYEFDGVVNFSVFNKRTENSFLVTLDERGGEVFATQFNPEDRSARMTFQGSTAVLSLKKPSDTPIPVAGRTASSASGRSENAQRQGSAEGERRERPAVPRRRVILPQSQESE